MAASLIVGIVGACSNVARLPSAATGPGASAGASAPGSVPPSGAAVGSSAATFERPHARWVAAAWTDLPDWNLDRVAEAWPAFLRSCERPAPAWLAACADARDDRLLPALGRAGAREWIEQHLRPWRVEALPREAGSSTGLATGYFEPLVDASRTSRNGFRIPLYAPPADLATRRPWYTRHQIDTLPTAQKSLRGHEVAWLRDPLDALVLHIQGSGRLAFVGADGHREPVVRVAFAGHNEQPYKSVGRWLVEQGELKLEQASWPSIRAWVRQNPKRIDEMLWNNPRYVFFREEPLPDPSIGPKGAQGVALTPGRSIAVDPLSVPYGTPVWLDTTAPLSATPLRRLVVAQDTGSAITGAVRADYFWGWGEDAESQAGRMKQPLRMWVLWPR